MPPKETKLLTTTISEANTWIEKKIQLSERFSELIDFNVKDGKLDNIIDQFHIKNGENEWKNKEELQRRLESL